MADNPLEGQPLVKLRHPDLESETTQPLSYARILVKDSGWQPANDAAADLLGVKTTKKARKTRESDAAATTEKGD